MASKLELSYMAGVVDSDGCITIIRGQSVRRAGIKYAELLAVAQCEPAAIDLLRASFGGSVAIRPQRTPTRRPMYQWSVTGRAAAAAIAALRPHLRIKRTQADICAEFRRLRSHPRIELTELTTDTYERETRWGKRVTRRRLLRPDVAEQYEDMARRIRDLNATRFPLLAKT